MTTDGKHASLKYAGLKNGDTQNLTLYQEYLNNKQSLPSDKDDCHYNTQKPTSNKYGPCNRQNLTGDNDCHYDKQNLISDKDCPEDRI